MDLFSEGIGVRYQQGRGHAPGIKWIGCADGKLVPQMTFPGRAQRLHGVLTINGIDHHLTMFGRLCEGGQFHSGVLLEPYPERGVPHEITLIGSRGTRQVPGAHADLMAQLRQSCCMCLAYHAVPRTPIFITFIPVMQ